MKAAILCNGINWKITQKHYIYIYTYIYIYIHTLLRLHILPHVVTLCFTYDDDDDDLQTGEEDGWVQS